MLNPSLADQSASLQIGDEIYTIRRIGFWKSSVEVSDARQRLVARVYPDKWYAHRLSMDYRGHSWKLVIRNNPLAEFLLLSVATCFCNDIYREAAKRGISIQGIDVEATGQFAAEKEPGSNFQYKAHVRSTAPAEEIAALIKYVDEIAEIHQTLRKGIAVKLIANHD